MGGEFWAAIVGAVVGAVASAVPAWLLARKASAETLRRDSEERRRADRVSGLQFFLVLSQVGNDVLSARNQVEQMLSERPIGSDERAPVQRRISILARSPLSPHNPFSDCDLAIFAHSEGIELINRVELLGRSYQTQISLFAEYRTQKQRLFEVYEQAKERKQSSKGTTIYTLNPSFGIIIAERETLCETLAVGLVECLRENSKAVFEISRFYDELVQTNLEELNLPRINMRKALDLFPDLVDEPSDHADC